jgi:cysteine synthase A
MIAASMLELVGDTPLVRIHGAWLDAGPPSRRPPDRAPRPRATVWAKMEHLNPGGSVKDRICRAMIEDAEARGTLRPPGPIVEPTSGNTGIGLAWVCAVKGYRLILTMPESMSLERRQLLEAYGAEIVLTPAEAQMDGAITEARKIKERTPGSFMPSQFDNPANPSVHARTTAHEILSAMDGLSIDAFVAAVGTGGTVCGVGPELKKVHPGVRVVAVEPETSATISRGERGPTKIQGIGAGFVPSNFRRDVVDQVRTVRDDDAWRTKLRLARREGLLVGPSAGANVFVAFQLAEELGEGKHVVTVLCDTGERYFSLDEYFPGIHADDPDTVSP